MQNVVPPEFDPGIHLCIPEEDQVLNRSTKLLPRHDQNSTISRGCPGFLALFVALITKVTSIFYRVLYDAEEQEHENGDSVFEMTPP